jgi:hypothetical protein
MAPGVIYDEELNEQPLSDRYKQEYQEEISGASSKRPKDSPSSPHNINYTNRAKRVARYNFNVD